jgi:hypothetical protein
MATTEDRERTRNQLQRLAELAKQVSPDSSGYVDLSTFSSTDPQWVENALSRARASEPPKIDRLDAESMRPVALESLLDPQEIVGPKTARMQKAFIIASSVCIAGLAVAAIALALRSPDAPRARPALAAAPVAAVVEAPKPAQAAITDTPAAAAAADGVAAAAAQAASPDTTAPVAPQGTPGASKRTKRKLAAPPQSVRVHSRAPSTNSSPLPAGRKANAAASDSLMGAIQQSIAAPNKK